MDIANAGMSKLKGILKKVSAIETVAWVVIGIVALILFFTFSSPLSKESEGIWIVGGIVIVLGIISGITLYFATEKDEVLIYKAWFAETLILIVCLVVGTVLAGILLGNGSSSSVEGWIALIFFVLLLPIQIYMGAVVWKFYKWNNRAGVVNAVASAFS